MNMFSFAGVDAEEAARIRILDTWLEDWEIVDHQQHFVSKSIKWGISVSASLTFAKIELKKRWCRTPPSLGTGTQSTRERPFNCHSHENRNADKMPS